MARFSTVLMTTLMWLAVALSWAPSHAWAQASTNEVEAEPDGEEPGEAEEPPDAVEAPEVDPEEPDENSPEEPDGVPPEGPQDPPEEPKRTSLDSDSQIMVLSKDELKREGWTFGDTTSLASSSTATIIALTGGIFVHGAGHFYSGESNVAWSLVGMESAGILAMLSAATYSAIDGGGGTANGLAAPLFQLGWSLFLNSYLLDVIGSIQGTDFEFEKNTLEEKGLSVDFGYGFIAAKGNPARHVLLAGLELDLDFVRVNASTVQDVLLVTSEYIAESDIRLFRVRPQTYVSLGFVGSGYNVADNAPFWRISAEGRLGGSLDLGHFFRKFDQVAMGTWLGIGNQWYVFDAALDLGDVDFTQLFVSHETFMHLNLTENLNIRIAHGSHPNSYVPQATRLFGVTDLGVHYKTALGRFSVSTLMGDGIALWLGGRLTL